MDAETSQRKGTAKKTRVAFFEIKILGNWPKRVANFQQSEIRDFGVLSGVLSQHMFELGFLLSTYT